MLLIHKPEAIYLTHVTTNNGREKPMPMLFFNISRVNHWNQKLSCWS